MMVHNLRFFCILIPQNNSDGCSYTSSAEQCYLDFVGTSLGNIDSFSLHNKYIFLLMQLYLEAKYRPYT